MELWKDIQGFEGLYQVSNMGNVRSFDRVIEVERNGITMKQHRKGKVLRQLPRKHGYLAVFLYKSDGKRTHESVHRLVASAFCERKKEATEVNHKNEIKTDNRAENLEWITHKENTNYGTAKERRNQTCREKRIRWKAVRQYDLDGNLVAEYPSLKEMEKQTGFSDGNVCAYLRGKIPSTRRPYGFHWEYVKGNKTEEV